MNFICFLYFVFVFIYICNFFVCIIHYLNKLYLRLLCVFCTCVFISMFVCICEIEYVCACLCVCTCVRVRVSVCLLVRLCGCVCVLVYVCNVCHQKCDVWQVNVEQSTVLNANFSFKQ